MEINIRDIVKQAINTNDGGKQEEQKINEILSIVNKYFKPDEVPTELCRKEVGFLKWNSLCKPFTYGNLLAVSKDNYSVAISKGQGAISIAASGDSVAATFRDNSKAIVLSWKCVAVAYWENSIATWFFDEQVMISYKGDALGGRYKSVSITYSPYKHVAKAGTEGIAISMSSYSTAIVTERMGIALNPFGKAIAAARGSIAIWRIVKWVKGSVLVLLKTYYYKFDPYYANVVSLVVDGVKIKENTYYMIRDWEVVEYNEEDE